MKQSRSSVHAYPHPERDARLEWAFCFALVLVLSTLFLFGAKLCNNYNADSILPTLMSKYRLTVFYWGQNRLGNLIPLIASPISNVVYNMAFQTACHIVAGFSIPWVALYLAGDSRYILLKYSLSIAVICTTYTKLGITTIFTEAYPFSLSALTFTIAYYLSSTMAGRRRAYRRLSILMAAGLFFVAFWLNIALVVFVLPLLVLFAGFFDRKRIEPLVLCSVGFGAAYVLMATQGPSYNNFQVSLHNYREVVDRMSTYAHTGTELTKILVLVGLLVSRVSFTSGTAWGDNRAARRSVAILVSAGIYFIVFCNSEHVRLNDYEFRYFMLQVSLLSCLLAGQIVDLVTTRYPAIGDLRTPSGKFVGASFCVAAVVASAARSGAPSSACTFDYFHETSSRLARNALDADVTMVAGDYWMVWPTIYQMAAQTPSSAGPRVYFGIAPRGEALRPIYEKIVRPGTPQNILCIDLSSAACWNSASEFAQTADVALAEPTRQSIQSFGPTSHFTILATRALAQGEHTAMAKPSEPLALSHATADFNHDGRSDVIWQDPQTGSALIAYEQTQALSSRNTLIVRPPLSSREWRIVGAGDFDGDGNLDLVFQNSLTGESDICFLDAPSKSCTSVEPLNGPNRWRISVVADLNKDGHPDLIWQDSAFSQNQVWFLGGFLGATVVSTSQINNIEEGYRIAGAVDFDGDGQVDIVAQNVHTGKAYSLMSAFSRQQNKLSISEANALRIGACGDFNGDGKPDLSGKIQRTAQPKRGCLSILHELYDFGRLPGRVRRIGASWAFADSLPAATIVG